jgi:MerR family transcriptional regulator, light-induced transcriptional regulator
VVKQNYRLKHHQLARYSIRELEKISGIKAHTIRIWEQRYQIFNPKRTETNIRYYDDCDLKLLLNISMLTLRGVRISRIAEMSESEISQHVQTTMEECGEYLTQVNAMLLAIIELDEARFEKIFATSILRFGFERTIIHIIYPLFTRVGIYWLAGTINPAQEHFLSNLVRQKIISAIDQLTTYPSADSQKFLLFLPEGENHEIPLLFAQWWLRTQGHQVMYLGQSVPMEDLLSVVTIIQPQFLFTAITARAGKDCPDDYLKLISSRLKNETLLVTGGAALSSECSPPPNVKRIHSLAELAETLNKLRLN